MHLKEPVSRQRRRRRRKKPSVELSDVSEIQQTRKPNALANKFLLEMSPTLFFFMPPFTFETIPEEEEEEEEEKNYALPWPS